jgi:hypothetical protein
MAVNECDFVPAWLFIVMNGCLTVINGSLTLIRLLVAYQKKTMFVMDIDGTQPAIIWDVNPNFTIGK